MVGDSGIGLRKNDTWNFVSFRICESGETNIPMGINSGGIFLRVRIR
jgi:hypothetical protein